MEIPSLIFYAITVTARVIISQYFVSIVYVARAQGFH